MCTAGYFERHDLGQIINEFQTTRPADTRQIVLFGLSMDYEVFLLSRIREAFERTGDNECATAEGLSAVASTITSAALIMVIVFGYFAFARVLLLQFLGFGLAVAVFLDATLIRMLLVPTIMSVAGRWNWWPGSRGGRDVDRD